MTTAFKRLKEDFTCEHCGQGVQGNGYTNHCPRCLWSKHVDVHPGDRAADCGGLMPPDSVETKAGETILIHQCQTCGHCKRNSIQAGDDYDTVIAVSQKPDT
ncbi:MAG: hypothetical protein COV10_01470 [Candidatus Vogelbacteria bacterium CG10_big_fil_rev_8_21_14_0_10_51_16]|uniref:RNHCP domain-containing protein n=1 Tax=Candidatus Vogelbacteria bacterium CG10_big_fil_rev_8_21_14_0_10_51_16 TaxID=1975045 RepID=A0A2H0RFA6_9BACT|nr:MAG: hypothetical protein COV10_01470 [Candidatus Vogelbacteria bacterium CG10_big_fil_rev_8_21_14_0_10_51_16]